MKNRKERKMKTLYRSFIFDLTLAVCALALGIIMLPPFGIGIYMLNVLLAASIVVYFLVYILEKLKRTKGAIFLLTVSETVVYFIVVIDLILEQFRLLDALNVCRALGIVLWVRGTVSAIGMYIQATGSIRRRGSTAGFVLRIFLICIGMYLMAHPSLTDKFLNWSICILFFISSLLFGGLALLFSPSKKK